jgi:iron complex outermembrane receptor protein
MRKSILLASTASLICFANLAYAEDDADANLPPVTVTSTKTQKAVTEAPASVSVVTDKDIETKNSTRIDEALSGTTGVYTKGLGEGTPSNYSNQILLRGMPGYQRTAVMVDGVTINDGFSQGVNASEIPQDNIKQIEVVPGPFSSLYGGSAMGGVVNIITKDPTKREFLTSGGYGSDGTYNSSGTYRDKFTFGGGYLGIVANLAHGASEGYVQTYVNKTPAAGAGANGTASGASQTLSTTGATQFTVGDQGNVGWTKNNADLKLVYGFDSGAKIDAEVLYSNYYTNYGAPNFYLTQNGASVPNGAASSSYTLQGVGQKVTTQQSDYLMTQTGDQVQRYKLGYEGGIWNDATLKATLSRQQDAYWYISPSTSATNSATTSGGLGYFSSVPSDRTDLDVQIGKPIGTQNYLIAGASGNLSTLNKRVNSMTDWEDSASQEQTVAVAKGRTETESLYVQDEYSPLSDLTLYGGGRYDTWTTSGNVANVPYSSYTAFSGNYGDRTSMAFSPKASAVYKLDSKTTLRTAWGEAFRTPSLSDMYSGYGSSGGHYSYPNSSLSPEKSRSWEVGGEHSFPTDTRIKGTYFNTQVSNLIYSYTGTDGNTYKTNAGGSHIHGIEAEIHQPVFGKVEVFANETLQSSLITENAAVPTSVGHMNTYTPKLMQNIGIAGDYQEYFGSFVVQHVSKTYATANSADYVTGVMGAADPYTIANAKIGWRFSENLTASLAVSNIFDETYYEYYRMPGRTYFATLSAHF